MPNEPAEKWSLLKQFEIIPKNYWRLIGYAWSLAVVLIPIFLIWAFFHKAPIQKIKVEKGATIINNVNDTKNWEAGIFGGGARLGDDNGFFAGLELKRRF